MINLKPEFIFSHTCTDTSFTCSMSSMFVLFITDNYFLFQPEWARKTHQSQTHTNQNPPLAIFILKCLKSHDVRSNSLWYYFKKNAICGLLDRDERVWMFLELPALWSFSFMLCHFQDSPRNLGRLTRRDTGYPTSMHLVWHGNCLPVWRVSTNLGPRKSFS